MRGGITKESGNFRSISDRRKRNCRLDLFQKYVTDEISLDEFCRKAQKIVEREQKK